MLRTYERVECVQCPRHVAIAWAVYHQSMFFAQGDMVGKMPLTSEWVQRGREILGKLFHPDCTGKQSTPHLTTHHSPNTKMTRRMMKIRMAVEKEKEKEGKSPRKEKPRIRRMKTKMMRREAAKSPWI